MANPSKRSKTKTPRLPSEFPRAPKTGWGKGVALYLVLAIIAIFVFFSVTMTGKVYEEIPLSQVLTNIKEGRVSSIVVEGDKLVVKHQDGQAYMSRKEPGESLVKTLETAGIDPGSVEVTIQDQAITNLWLNILSTVAPLVLMALFFLFIFRQARGTQDTLFSFGRSKARLFSKKMAKVTFDDVAGVDEAKKELEEVVDFLKSPKKYQKMGARTPKGVLLLGPPGTGKCVTGDTIVWTNKGLIAIGDIPRYYFVDSSNNKVYGATLPNLNPQKLEDGEHPASHWFCLGKQRTIRLKTALGFALEGTPEHPIVVMGNDGRLRFKQLAEIEVGDIAAIKFNQQKFGNADLVDSETAYFMGILTGDGNLSHSSRVGLTGVDPQIIDFFCAYIKSRFPKTAIYKNRQSYLAASWELKRFLYQKGMSYLLSFDKTIPPSILQAPKEVVVAFLRGLFDTDASFNRCGVEYTTVSLKLAKQVQALLLNLGIISSLTTKGDPRKYKCPVYRLMISGSGLRNFAKEVNFDVERKRDLVRDYLEKVGGSTNTNVDLFYHIAPLVEEYWRQLSARKMSDESLAKNIDKIRHRRRVSRRTLSLFLRRGEKHRLFTPEYKELKKLFEANLFFTRVLEKRKGFGTVYDFTVPSSHAFIGNGFINHNTLLARALAGEANVPFFSMAGSEFMEMLVGVGSARMRDLFQTAKKNAPSIIFIDEVEGIGRVRSLGVAGGHDEREQTLNQMLVEMDGFAPNDNVVVIAASNRPDLLDPALLRPGRFDRRIVLDMPDIEGRKAILKIHMKGKPFASDVSWDKVAKRTVGFSGADLENMLNEAAILAARLGKKAIDMSDLEEAATKVKLGPEKKRLQSDEARKMTAYHEAGHAVVVFNLPHMDPVHRVSIVSRGLSLGYTLFPPAKDRYTETRSHLLEMVTAALGGRAAEEMVFNEFTSGAASDIVNATRIVRQMVVEYGMSDLGPINFGPQFDKLESGRMFLEPTQLSPDMQARVDREIKKMTDKCYKKAVEILRKNRRRLDLVAQKLLEQETIEGEDFEKLMKGAKN